MANTLQGLVVAMTLQGLILAVALQVVAVNAISWMLLYHFKTLSTGWYRYCMEGREGQGIGRLRGPGYWKVARASLLEGCEGQLIGRMRGPGYWKDARARVLEGCESQGIGRMRGSG